MTFKKLALAAAVACAVPAAFAADYIADDSTLSGVTGQDGIVIGLDLAVTTDVIVHDLDGVDGGVPTYANGYSFAGAIIMTGVNITTGAGGLSVAIDAGDQTTGSTGSAPMLNVNVSIPAGTSVQTGALTVGNSNRDNSAWGYSNATATIMESATLSLSGGAVANIQLGNETQGHMIRLNTVIANGVSLSGMALNDVGGAISGGAIGAGLVTVTDNAAPGTLTLDVGVDADATNGLVISLDTLGNAGGIDVHVERQYLGTTTLGYIGDVELVGLNLNGSSISVHGK